MLFQPLNCFLYLDIHMKEQHIINDPNANKSKTLGLKYCNLRVYITKNWRQNQSLNDKLLNFSVILISKLNTDI